MIKQHRKEIVCMQNTKKQITEKQRKHNLLVSIIITTIVSLYIGLRLGSFMTQLEEPNLLFAVFEFAKGCMDKPWVVYPTDIVCVFIGLIIGSFFDLYFYNQYYITKDTVENAHGDAAFEDNFDEYEREFVCSPKYISEKTGVKMTDKNCPRNEEGKKVFSNLKKPFSNPGSYKNAVEYCRRRSMIYTDTVYLSLDGSWCQRNANSIVFGASGTGKSRYFLKPNILQGTDAGSFICTDPSGDILIETGYFLKKEGYTIKCFNISDMTKSCRFNPLYYIRSVKDIPIIAQTFLDNMKGEGASKGSDGDFWDKAAQALLCCCIGYLYEVCPLEERNFANVLDLMRKDKHEENENPGTDSEFDLMFKELGMANPASYAFQCYQTYRQAPIRTANSILISTTVNLQQLDIPEVRNLTYKDEMELDKLGSKPMAIFLNIPQAENTYCWLTALMYSILFKRLYSYGENRMKLSAYGIDIDEYEAWLNENELKDTTDSIEQFKAVENRTKVKPLGNPEMKCYVRFLIDECANVGKIPNLEKYLATCRKYRIAIVPIFQNYSQIVEVYGKDKANNIVSNCDAFLFLGGSDEDTLKIIQSHLGKETVKTLSNSMTYSSKGNNSASKQQTGKELMSRIQVEQMSNADCLLFIRALRPFKTKKYDLTTHPNYKYLAEGDDGDSYANPFYLPDDDETDDLIESVRIKGVYEEGYHKPQIVNNARRRALIETNKKKVEDLQQMLPGLIAEEQTALAKNNKDEADKIRSQIEIIQQEISKLEQIYKVDKNDTPSPVTGNMKREEELIPSIITPSEADIQRAGNSKGPEFIDDLSDAISVTSIGGYNSAYEFEEASEFSLDKFINPDNQGDVQEQIRDVPSVETVREENSDAIANLFAQNREPNVIEASPSEPSSIVNSEVTNEPVPEPPSSIVGSSIIVTVVDDDFIPKNVPLEYIEGKPLIDRVANYHFVNGFQSKSELKTDTKSNGNNTDSHTSYIDDLFSKDNLE